MNMTNNKELNRLAKQIAKYGYCSRRDAEVLIFDNKVFVNDKLVNNPAIKVSADDIIKINGKIINNEVSSAIYLYNKPAGLITTFKDPNNRKTVFDDINEKYMNLGRLLSVGRLDINSEGLLILTNNPTIANYLEKSKAKRVYKVRISGQLKDYQIKQILKGIVIKGIKYNGVQSIETIENKKENSSKNTWIQISLIEGKNREIRNIMNYFGLQVSRLIRISYHIFELGNLKKSELLPVNTEKVNLILKEIKNYKKNNNSK